MKVGVVVGEHALESIPTLHHAAERALTAAAA
jgi:hypothetical protein